MDTTATGGRVSSVPTPSVNGHHVFSLDCPETKLHLPLDQIIQGDCLTVLPTFPDECVDLVVTSPPYADNRRKGPYKGVPVDGYADWFLPISLELKRVLKPRGSFVLNIKERAIDGERQIYVLQLILKMREHGWLWVEEYVWNKKNSYPGKWPNRFRDAWERCLHFTKQKQFDMYQDRVMVPMGDWAKSRLKNLSQEDKRRHESAAQSGLGRKVANWVGRESAYPTNVLHLPTESSNRKHSAAFPFALPEWFIKLFTNEGDVVLDPFIGSGTTAIASIRQGRHFVGIEVSKEYVELAKQAITRENGNTKRMM